jgi:hypothetical protein
MAQAHGVPMSIYLSAPLPRPVLLPLGLCNDKLQLFALKSDPWRHDRARIVS